MYSRYLKFYSAVMVAGALLFGIQAQPAAQLINNPGDVGGEVSINIDVSGSAGEMPKVLRAGLMGLPADEKSRPLIMASEDLQLKPYLRTHFSFGLHIANGDAPRRPGNFDQAFIDQIKKMDITLKQYQDKGFQLIISIEGPPKWLSKYPSDECLPNADGCFNRWPFSPPSDYEAWKSLIRKFVSTQIEDGINADYIVWDEPDWMFYGTKEQYFELYKHTAAAIKEVNPASKVGGPGLSGFGRHKESNCPVEDGFPNTKDISNCPESKLSMMEEFINYVGGNKLPLDFIDWHFANQYDIDYLVKKIKEWLIEAGLPENIPLTIGEWIHDKKSEAESAEAGAASVISMLKAFADAGVYRHTATSVYDQCGWESGEWQNAGYLDARCPGEKRIGVIKAKWNSFEAIDRFAAGSSRLSTTINGNEDNVIVALASRTQDEQTTKILVSNFIHDGTRIILRTFKSSMLSKGYSEDELRQIQAVLQQTIEANPPVNGVTSEYLRQIVQLADFPDPFNDAAVKLDLSACVSTVVEKVKEIQYYQNNPRQVRVSLANLKPGKYNFKTYVIDKDHSNPCKYNKKTEPTSSPTECGIDGAVDTSVERAELESQEAALDYFERLMVDGGYPLSQIRGFVYILSQCAFGPGECDAVSSLRQLVNFYGYTAEQKAFVLAAVSEAYYAKTDLFYYGHYKDLSISTSIDQINNDPNISLEGSKQETQVRIDSGTFQTVIPMDPYAVLLIEFFAIPNNPPAVSPIGNKSVNEGATLAFTVSAKDPDGDTLTYSATGLPAGATFDASTHAFNWTPNYNQSGIYSATFTVTDPGGLGDSETIAITVNNVNRPPVMTPIGSKSVNEGARLAFTVSATDPDGDALTYSATGLPAGATFNASTRAFNWTPTYSQSGSYSVMFKAADPGGLSASATAAISVANVPVPDLVTSGVSSFTSMVSSGSAFILLNTATNQGAVSAGSFIMGFSLSKDAVYGGTDDIAFAATRSVTSLAVGATSSASTSLTVPATTPSGSYYVCASADSGNTVRETNEANNGRCTTSTIQIVLPDLVMTQISGLTSASPGTNIILANTVKNQGVGSAGSFSVGFYLSTDAAITTADTLIGARGVSSLAAGVSSSATTSVMIPWTIGAGGYYLGAIADYNNMLAETNETNNARAGNTLVLH